jgi:hypothetical protein
LMKKISSMSFQSPILLNKMGWPDRRTGLL